MSIPVTGIYQAHKAVPVVPGLQGSASGAWLTRYSASSVWQTRQYQWCLTWHIASGARLTWHSAIGAWVTWHSGIGA